MFLPVSLHSLLSSLLLFLKSDLYLLSNYNRGCTATRAPFTGLYLPKNRVNSRYDVINVDLLRSQDAPNSSLATNVSDALLNRPTLGMRCVNSYVVENYNDEYISCQGSESKSLSIISSVVCILFYFFARWGMGTSYRHPLFKSGKWIRHAFLSMH